MHRAWIDSLPPLLLADGIEFPKSKVTLYAYRHAYAQRHADADVPPDVLRELLDHLNFDTTRQYYDPQELHQTSEPGLAAMRWPVGRTNAWHNAFSRLQRCCERRGDMIDAFFDLADAIITVRSLIRQVWTTLPRGQPPGQATVSTHLSATS